ncbi:MAG: thermonuclease family protein [Planctomycetes bacterium]|nr:thermonuclease family protein [Planctomycetota bacterium]
MMLTLLALAALVTPTQSQTPYPERASDQQVLRECVTEAPKVLYEVKRVVDGDTIWIEREGKLEKLRLLSVDTEEKFMKGGDLSEYKPSTRYGDQCTGWAQGFFMPRSADEGPVRVGLRFPGGVEARDIYGRLLCQVVTEQGIDFNLLLVRRGLSPYFNKYGNSRICHQDFVAAQAAAQKEQIGIWDPKTNEAGKHRPYDRLLPWWEARAQAIDSFRAQAEAKPEEFIDSENLAALEAAKEKGPHRVTVLGTIAKVFDENDGGKTVLLRGSDKKLSIRVPIAARDVAAMEKLDLLGSMAEFRQNYWTITGTLAEGSRSLELRDVSLENWKPAGPEPKSK